MTDEEKAFITWLDSIKFWDVLGPKDVAVILAKYRQKRADGISDAQVRQHFTAIMKAQTS